MPPGRPIPRHTAGFCCSAARPSHLDSLLSTFRTPLQGETVPYIICVRKAISTADAVPPPSPLGAASDGLPPSSPAPAAASAPPPAAPVAAKPSGGGSFAERAFHPEELRESGGTLVVDVEYYLGQQVRLGVNKCGGM